MTVLEEKRVFDLTNIRKNIEVLMEVALDLNDAENRHINKIGNQTLLPPMEWREKFTGTVEEAKEKFFNVLNGFKDEEVWEIISVMYAGRDYVLTNMSDRFVTLQEQYGDFYKTSIPGCQCTLYEKAPLVDYLRAGMKYYGI